MRSIENPSAMHTTTAAPSPIIRTAGHGRTTLSPSSQPITARQTIAPTIVTSPCAKLMSSRMPYTMV